VRSRQELFNFFDFHGTGLISHEDLKQVLGQEPLGDGTPRHCQGDVAAIKDASFIDIMT
jgi:Ca2+-binding EF-hand superfamily protein